MSDINDVPFAVNSAIIVTFPNTAVAWAAGSRRTIAWRHFYGAGQTFDLDFSGENGATWSSLATGVPSATANTGSHDVTVPSVIAAQALVRVSPAGNPANGDLSNVTFRVDPPSIKVTAPVSARWDIGTVKVIKWTHTLGQLEAVDIDISRDGGATWTSIAANLANSANGSGTLSWNGDRTRDECRANQGDVNLEPRSAAHRQRDDPVAATTGRARG